MGTKTAENAPADVRGDAGGNKNGPKCARRRHKVNTEEPFSAAV